MPVVVEDGTGLAAANSYASVATADAYFSARGLAAWASLETEKEVQTLTITAACSVNGDIVVTLNGVAFTIAVTTAADTAAKVAIVIRAATFAGWVVTGADATVIFTANAAGARAGSYSLAVASTGVTGSIAQTQVGSTDSKDAALIRGSQALDGLYSGRWPGIRSNATQGLDWPRYGAFDIDGYTLDGLPIAIVNAACEAALSELTSAGSLTTSSTNGVKREKVGPLETEYFSASGSSTVHATINSALSRIVRSTGAGVKFSRG